VSALAFHDVSNHNPDHIPNGPTIAKATEGSSFKDPLFQHFRQLTLAKGYPFLAYHYLTTDDPVDQAFNLYDVVGRETRVLWDFEKGGGDLANLVNVHRAFTTFGGHATLAYIPHWYWQSIGSPSLAPLIELGLSLVSSDYSEPYSDMGVGWRPYGGITPAIWQYRGSPLDTNAFRGTLSQLADLFEGNMLTASDRQWITDTIARTPHDVWNYDPNNSEGIHTPQWRPDSTTNPSATPQWFIRYGLDMLHTLALQEGYDLSDLPTVTPVPPAHILRRHNGK
jgi:hypothetical protein